MSREGSDTTYRIELTSLKNFPRKSSHELEFHSLKVLLQLGYVTRATLFPTLTFYPYKNMKVFAEKVLMRPHPTNIINEEIFQQSHLCHYITPFLILFPLEYPLWLRLNFINHN